MRGGNKRPTHPNAIVLRAAFDEVSKAALMDIVGDLLDLAYGEGKWGAHEAVTTVAPRLAVRGDREPAIWKALRRKPRPPGRPEKEGTT